MTTASDAFADIDVGATQEFELYIPEFSRNDVLCLDVICIPDTVSDKFSENDAQNLDVFLKTAPLENDIESRVEHTVPGSTYLPSYHSGEYEFGLTSAHGMTAGRYILSVTNRGTLTQSIRAHLAVCQYVTAQPLQSGECCARRTVQGEFTYFRYLRKDPTQLISIRVVPLDGEHLSFD